MLNIIRKLLQAREGTTMIEFAVVAPVMFTFFLSTIEFGMLFTASAVLENAASHASRFGLTGAVEEGKTREESILAIVKDRASSMINPEEIHLVSKVYEHFDQIGQEEPYNDDNGNGAYDPGETYNDINGNGQWDNDMASSGAGGAGDIVIYTVTYDWELIIPMIGDMISENGKFPLSATVIVRNEPFENVEFLGG